VAAKRRAARRKVEIFSAGCAACREAIRLVKRMACPSCEVTIRDMNKISVARRARRLGIRTVPAVVIQGKLAECCAGSGLAKGVLRVAGLGRPL
jgi:hypothetical protein